MHGRRAEASIAVPFVLVPGLGGHGWNDNDPAIPGDFNPRDVHTGAADGLDRSGHVLLPECGGGARHWITVAKSAYRPSVEIAARHRRTTMLRDVAVVAVVRFAPPAYHRNRRRAWSSSSECGLSVIANRWAARRGRGGPAKSLGLVAPAREEGAAILYRLPPPLGRNQVGAAGLERGHS